MATAPSARTPAPLAAALRSLCADAGTAPHRTAAQDNAIQCTAPHRTAGTACTRTCSTTLWTTCWPHATWCRSMQSRWAGGRKPAFFWRTSSVIWLVAALLRVPLNAEQAHGRAAHFLACVLTYPTGTALLRPLAGPLRGRGTPRPAQLFWRTKARSRLGRLGGASARSRPSLRRITAACWAGPSSSRPRNPLAASSSSSSSSSTRISTRWAPRPSGACTRSGAACPAAATAARTRMLQAAPSCA